MLLLKRDLSLKIQNLIYVVYDQFVATPPPNLSRS